MNPKWYGFNVLWLFSAGGKNVSVNPAQIHIDERDLDCMVEMGCNFVRIPTDYRFFIHDFNYGHYDETMLKILDDAIHAVTSRGMHCSLNVHRGPGYCINGNEFEKDNLWTDKIAQDAFLNYWKMFAERYSSYNSKDLSFDLLNEPPNPGDYGLTHENHAEIMTTVYNEIKKISPDRKIIIDGLGCGHLAVPELAGLGAIHSGRGYQPFEFTHYKAPWVKHEGEWPQITWPDMKINGKTWNKQALRDFYAPWKTVADTGCPVHIGEGGCYNAVDNQVALKWYEDWFSVLNEYDFGFALWNFRGPFGIAEHGRKNTKWEVKHGIAFDSELYALFKNHIRL